MRRSNVAIKMQELFARVSANNVSDSKLVQLDNGLIKSSNGFYALTEHIETGDINIIWSREQQYLLGAIEETDLDGTLKEKIGINRLQSDEYVYFINTLPLQYGEPSIKSRRKPIFDKTSVRSKITTDFINFLVDSAQGMHLHMMDGSDFYGSMRVTESGEISQSNVIMLSNPHVGYSITNTAETEEKEQKWKLKKYPHYSRIHSAEGLTEINGTNVDEDPILKLGFTNGFQIKEEFDLQINAFKAIFKIWTDDSQKFWRGEKLIEIHEAPYPIFRTMIYDAVIKEVHNKENIEEGFFDSIVEAGPLLLVGFKILGPTLPVAIAVTVTTGFLMRKGLSAFKFGIDEIQWLRKGAKSINPDIAEHIAPDRKNQKRLRKKLSPDFISKNKLLTMSDLPKGGITQDFEKVRTAALEDVSLDKIDKNGNAISINDDTSIDEWFATFKNKGFTIFDAVTNDFGIVDVCPNGLVRFESTNPDTRNKVIYSTYIPDFDTNPHIAIPDRIKTLLQEKSIIKVEQLEEEGGYTRKYIPSEHFFDDLSEFLGRKDHVDSNPDIPNSSIETICQFFRSKDIFTNGDSITLPKLSQMIPKEKQAEPTPTP